MKADRLPKLRQEKRERKAHYIVRGGKKGGENREKAGSRFDKNATEATPGRDRSS
jgi:hypothetical protein